MLIFLPLLFLFIILLHAKLSNISVLLFVCLQLCVYTQLCIFESDLFHSQLLFVGQIITMLPFLHVPVLSYQLPTSTILSAGDTLFIVLRKQKLIFLHWYHHITVLLYSWYSYKDMVAGGGWFMTMNYLVHAVMYSYYALRAAGFKLSRKFAMFITLTQITQMLMGCVVNCLVYSWMQQGQECPSHMQNIVWSSLMYLSYFVLFVQFFFEAYIGKSKSSAMAVTKKSE